MLAKEWRDAWWKLVLAAVAVLAFEVFALRPYGAILKQAEFQIPTKAEFESPEKFGPPEEAFSPGYTPASYEADLRDEFERMQQPGYPAEVAGFEMKDLQAGASYVGPCSARGAPGRSAGVGRGEPGDDLPLLSRPISRARILLTKYSVGAAAMLVVAQLGGVGIVVSGYARRYPAAAVNATNVIGKAGLLWLRTLSVFGAGCVVEEGNVLDQGARVNPGVRPPKGVISF